MRIPSLIKHWMPTHSGPSRAQFQQRNGASVLTAVAAQSTYLPISTMTARNGRGTSQYKRSSSGYCGWWRGRIDRGVGEKWLENTDSGMHFRHCGRRGLRVACTQEVVCFVILIPESTPQESGASRPTVIGGGSSYGSVGYGRGLLAIHVIIARACIEKLRLHCAPSYK